VKTLEAEQVAGCAGRPPATTSMEVQSLAELKAKTGIETDLF
jgi:hypothetical protein